MASVGATRRTDRQARYVYDLTDTRIPARIGNKAENLRFLIQHGVPVPAAWVCTWDAHLDYESAGAVAPEQLRSELAGCVRPGRSYAVRSSANVEDDLGHSFAGQFRTHLHVEGADDVLDAVEAVWRAARSADVQTYFERHAIPQDRLKMAVLIQEMVPPYISGVSFSKNPVTGLDEVIVEAVDNEGDVLTLRLGDAVRLVQRRLVLGVSVADSGTSPAEPPGNGGRAR